MILGQTDEVLQDNVRRSIAPELGTRDLEAMNAVSMLSLLHFWMFVKRYLIPEKCDMASRCLLRRYRLPTRFANRAIVSLSKRAAQPRPR